MRSVLALALIALAAAAVPLREARADGEARKQGEFQERVDAAILRGCEALASPSPARAAYGGRDAELVALTLAHGGWPREREPLASSVNALLRNPLRATYNVALTSVALLHIDRMRYQRRIAECAQWLVDNQCPNGQWSYGDFGVQGTGTGGDPTVETGGGGFDEIRIRRRRTSAAGSGDNSNTQFALLGLYAAHLAKVKAPAETWKKARDFFLSAQSAHGGWSYSRDGDQVSYGSMTCAGVTALEVCARATTRDSRAERSIARGLDWLANNFSVRRHPGRETGAGGAPDTWYYYYLYSLERAGVLCDVRRFAGRDWYREGAELLLTQQKEDGTWGAQSVDTCFAILFLKRATESLTGTGGGRAAVSTPDDDLGEAE